MVISIPNEAAMRQVAVASETTAGTPVTGTMRLLGELTATPGIGAIRRSEDATGGYDRTAKIRRQTADPSGTYGGGLSFEELEAILQWSVSGAPTVTSGGSPAAYTRVFAPSFATDDIKTFSAQYGVTGMPRQLSGARFTEITISGDATANESDWQVSGNLLMKSVDRLTGTTVTATGGSTNTVQDTGASWSVDQFKGQYIFRDPGSHAGEVRLIASNTSDTITVSQAFSTTVAAADVFYIAAALPSIAVPDYESIDVEGTKVYLDEYNPSSSNIGTTEISDRILSFSITQALNLATKRRMPGVIGRMGRGAREVSGTMRFEMDRDDEFMAWLNNKELSLRIMKEGSNINASNTKLAQIDIERAVFDGETQDTDNNNMTVSMAFVALLPASDPVWQITTRTGVSTLA